MTTTEIIDEFNTLINKDQDYTLAELKTILSDVYKAKTGKKVGKKVVKEEKPAKVTSDEEESEEDKPKKKGRPTKGPKLDKDGNEKKKRAPTAYNIFVKDKSAEMRKEHPEMSAKEAFTAAAALWSSQKEVKE